MNSVLRNQRGFALVYGLVVLLLATVGGTALLFMAQKDRIAAADYSQMRSASQAAMVAIKAFEGDMLYNAAASATQLQQYLDDPAKKYLFGSTASATENKIKLWGNAVYGGVRSPEYSGKILGFDKSNFMITIEGKGYGSNGGKKRIIASYKLDGVGINDISMGKVFGLYLGGELSNCNARIHIKGDVYLSMEGSPTGQHFNQGGVIDGNLKTAATSNVLDFSGGGDLSVTGYAFMQCRLMPQAVFKVTGDAGFTYPDFYNFTTAIKVDGNAYFTQTSNFGFDGCIDGDAGGGKTVYYNVGSVWANRFKDFTNKTQIPTSTATYVATQLGTTTAAELPLGINLPTWGTGIAQNVSGTVTGANIDSWWNAKSAAGTLFQGEWLVLNVNGSVSMNGGTFTKKAIWITNNYQIIVNKKWPSCDLTSNTLIIANGSGSLSGMGVPNGSNFRGLIYHTASNVTTNTIYQFGGNSKIYGAIQHAGKAKFNLNGGAGDTLNIWFKDPIGESAIQEIVNTGIILAPGAGAPPPRVLQLDDTKIRPEMISIQL